MDGFRHFAGQLPRLLNVPPPPELVSLSDAQLLDVINEEMEGMEHELSTNEFALMTRSWKERKARIEHCRTILNSRT